MAPRSQLDLLAGFEGEHRRTAQDQHPLVLRLVVPARFRGGVSAGDDALDTQLPGLENLVEQLRVGIDRQVVKQVLSLVY